MSARGTLALGGAAMVFFATYLPHGHSHLPHSHPHFGHGGAPAANVALANQMAAAHGWTGTQRWCLDTLWEGESGFSQYADTRKSGLDAANATVYAYGIPQARPAQKMAAAGPDWRISPATQIRWGLDYIGRTYGTPCNALAFKRAHGNQGY